MKQLNNRNNLLAIFAVLSLAACQKNVEVYQFEEDNSKKSNSNKDCQIFKIHFTDAYRSYDGRFFYNNKGNPDSVIFDFVGTGFPNIYFVHDNGQALRQAKMVYGDGTYEVWHRYGYTNQTITTDTVYAFGSANAEPEPGNHMSKRINYIEYDNQGRIIRETEDYVIPDLPTVLRTYNYDDNGNLQVPGVDFQYDDQANPHSLDKCWQLLGRNYSANNPVQASIYNLSGLPLRFDLPASQPTSHRFAGGGRALDRSEIEYACKKAKDIFY